MLLVASITDTELCEGEVTAMYGGVNNNVKYFFKQSSDLKAHLSLPVGSWITLVTDERRI